MIEKLTPETVLLLGIGYVPVTQTVAYPPGKAPEGAPIREDLWAVEQKTAYGLSRWRGFAHAMIDSSLRMRVTLTDGQERDEVVMGWEDPA